MNDNEPEFSRRPDFNLIVLFVVCTLVVLAGATATGCESTSRSAEPDRRALVEAVPVTLTDVREVARARTVHAMGRVAHDRDVRLGFKTGGLVHELLVEEGQHVRAGDVVARLDTREIDAAVAQASASVGKARRDLDRAEGLVAQNVVPGAQRDDARTAARVASAQLANAKFHQETATLVAPVSGIVIKRLAEPGEVVAPGMPVLVIGAEGQGGTVLVEAGVPARDALDLAVGDVAEVQLDGAGAATKASIIELAPTLVPGTDQVLVTLRLTSNVMVPRGLVAHVSLVPPRGGTLPAVPIAAIVEGEGDAANVYALNADGETVARKKVRVAEVRSDGLVLVASGLAGVKQVVDAGTAWLDDGARVKVQPVTSAVAP